jgi:hypothetical protein
LVLFFVKRKAQELGLCIAFVTNISYLSLFPFFLEKKRNQKMPSRMGRGEDNN